MLEIHVLRSQCKPTELDTLGVEASNSALTLSPGDSNEQKSLINAGLKDEKGRQQGIEKRRTRKKRVRGRETRKKGKEVGEKEKVREQGNEG